MRTAQYARVVIRISEREGITARRARALYVRAVRQDVKDLSSGLEKRVQKAERVRRIANDFLDRMARWGNNVIGTKFSPTEAAALRYLRRRGLIRIERP